jgi:hypothetical protein
MNEKRNIDWTAAFALAARAGPHELIRALRTAMEYQYTTATEQFDATLARQRATFDEILAQERAEFERNYATLRNELLAMIDNEVTTLRRELEAANAELARLRALQPAH